MKPTKTWIVVADGDQARIFEHDGPGRGLHPVDGLALEQPHLKAQDIMADKPGRSFSSAGPNTRSAVDYRTDLTNIPTARLAGHFDGLLAI